MVSLCEVGNSQYMWDEYAGGNSGVCIEYGVVGPDDALEAPFKRVTYDGMYEATRERWRDIATDDQDYYR